ncbi:MAG: ferrous iron transport protein A [Candidatus Cloacimonetes bacterium]|nr:ferrous iron transport protein A [Candidatus Cloacimonadota bacterium]
MVKVNLAQMKSGEQGTVMAINGGFGLKRRVEALGVRVGVNVKKISSQLMRGPITVQVGNTQVALGFGMAQKIIVEID